jgi:hypothetical protein
VTCTSAVLGFIPSALAAAASAARICASRSSDTYMLTSHIWALARPKSALMLCSSSRSAASKEVRAFLAASSEKGLVPFGPAVEGVIKGIEAVAMLARSAPALSRDELHVDSAGQPRGDLVLRIEEVGVRLVEAFGPKMRAALGVDELGADPDPVVRALHAAFENVTQAEPKADLANIDRPALVAAGGVARNHEEAGNAGEIGRQRSVTPSTK